ncbi:hypothetical protein AB0H34_38825 [Saccharopolyspora shandongensis]|uniref:arsenate reductase/protein-tyrosine-phosphatase family protein n=1 Tax=Saccharopolyspora shandongensis TaxID=418495 RepID=UPI0033C105D3
MTPTSATDGRFRIHFVCTGNLCRSPTAEIAFRKLLPVALGAAASRFDVSSAGTHARLGEMMDPESLRALSDHGLVDGDVPEFHSRPITAETIRRADLVLTATRSHRRAVVQARPEALARTFTVLEFARLLGSVDRTSLPIDPLDRFRAGVVAARDRRGTIPAVPKAADDIHDRRGRTPAAHDEALVTIHNALLQILGVLALREQPGVPPLVAAAGGGGDGSRPQPVADPSTSESRRHRFRLCAHRLNRPVLRRSAQPS